MANQALSFTTDFVDLPFTAAESDLEDIAITYLENAWPGYVAAEGDPETVLIEALAPLASNAAAQAAVMPQAALIAFGLKLLNQPYGNGTSAYTTLQITVQDNAGYTILAGNSISIDGYAFVTTQDCVIAAGSTTGTVLVASLDTTADVNGLTGSTSLTQIAMPSFVVGLSLLAPTANGADPQTDDDYANQISRDRRLTSRALVVGLDFELAALDVAGIARAHVEIGAGRAVTVYVLSSTGGLVPAPIKTTLLASFNAAKLVNAVITIADPVIVPVGITYSVVGESGFQQADLILRINAALTTELSPLTSGSPQSGDPGGATTTWITDAKIYVNRMIQVIGEVQGVHRVTSVVLAGQYAAHLSSTLSTGAPITSLPVTALDQTIPTAAVITLNDGAGHTQTWTTTAQANAGATTIAVTSQTPNFAYTATALLSGPVLADFALPTPIAVPSATLAFTGTATS